MVPPNTIPDEAQITLNLPVLLFTLAVSVVAALLFGIAPALQPLGPRPADAAQGRPAAALPAARANVCCAARWWWARWRSR